MAAKLDMTALMGGSSSRSDTFVRRSTPSESIPDEPVIDARPKVTAAVVDEAVNSVLSEFALSVEEETVIRRLLASDPSTDFAGALYSSRAMGRGGGLYPKLARKTVVIPQVLTSEETADLVSYTPEFDLKFMDQENHDHAMGAAMRKLDTKLIENFMPAGMKVKDVGADPIYLINVGDPNSHGCNPDHDLKDPARGTVRRMRARKNAMDTSRSEQTRALAVRYLERDETFVCSKSSMDCEHKAAITRSIHVYDVKLQDWPQIIAKSGAAMHFGVLLFPQTAYGSVSGEMKTARARYEIDVVNNRFRMGFLGSASWFYDHDWLDYMRYGVDQMIESAYGRFSYKVIERRGDTLIFQILKVDDSTLAYKQYYNVPGVSMVRVEGFDYQMGKSKLSMMGRSALVPKVHWFPQALWMDMLVQAERDFERGAFSFDAMYNYYRTVSPRNTINGILISGGQRVGEDQIVSLVTHVSMCAAKQVMLGQKTTKAAVGNVFRDRARLDEAAMKRLLVGLWEGAKTFMSKTLLLPLVWICDKIIMAINGAVNDVLASWTVEPMVKEVPFSETVAASYAERIPWLLPSEHAEDVFRDHVLRYELADHIRAADVVARAAPHVQELLGDAIPQFSVTAEVDGTTAVPTVVDVVVGEDVQAARRMAIQECLDESELEEAQIRGFCADVFRVCTDAVGEPNLDMMRSRAEEYGQPDFWQIRNGVLLKSALGLEALECNYSALYTLYPDADGYSFQAVVDEHYQDTSGENRREYKRLGGTRYTGWALSLDRLLIYNGPEIRATLEKAKSMDHSYVVELRQGPPGCGKTYDLIQGMSVDHVAMCPVRESAMDTRSRLSDKLDAKQLKLQVRTVDSYLTNYLVPATKDLKTTVLHADEAFMAHSGKWYAAAALLGVERVVAYGDVKQIPHVQRVQAQGLYIRILADVQTVKYETRRCPADAVAAWAHIYEYRVRTLSKVVKSLSVTTDWRQVQLHDGHILMCMYQADKKELRKMFSARIKSMSLKILTVHESEGKTFKHVMLFRFDSRPRNDKMSLFDREPYALVAMSRHTDSFAYVRPKNLNDCIDAWFQKSLNPRAVAAAADIASKGKSVQYL